VDGPTLPGRVTQAEIRVGKRLWSWAIYGSTLGLLGSHPHSGRGHLVCEIQPCFWHQLVCPFIAPVGMVKEDLVLEQPCEQGCQHFLWLQT
jgi:hypothetical protein